MGTGKQYKPIGGVIYEEFGGLVTNADTHDIGTAAVAMLNITTLVPGQLTVRKGHAAVSFADSDPGSPLAIVAAYRLERTWKDYCIVQVDGGGANDGIIRARETPT